MVVFGFVQLQMGLVQLGGEFVEMICVVVYVELYIYVVQFEFFQVCFGIGQFFFVDFDLFVDEFVGGIVVFLFVVQIGFDEDGCQ